MIQEVTTTKEINILIDGIKLGYAIIQSHKNGETYCELGFELAHGHTTCKTVDPSGDLEVKLRFNEDKDELCKALEYSAKAILSLVECINSNCPQLPSKPSKEKEIDDILKKTEDWTDKLNGKYVNQEPETLSPEQSC